MNYALLSTEICTTILGVGLFALDLVLPRRESRRGAGWLAIFGLAVIFGLSFLQYGQNSSLYHGMFRVDDFAVFFKQLFLAATGLTILFSLDYAARFEHQGEFYGLLVFAALGMMVMASANDLLTLYIGLELMSVSFFILVAFALGDGKAAEAGIKYLVLGAASSAVLLYGMSLVFGFTGSLILTEIAKNIAPSPAIIVGTVFIIAGFAFKTSAVPFHMWTPDIYEGAPAPITALLAMGSKAAGFAVFTRVFVSAFPSIKAEWFLILAVMAALSMVIGNLVAIPQTNIKRMLAYSSIGQAGYLLVGLLAADPAGVKAILFYAMLYVLANVGAFAVVAAVNVGTGSDDIAAYAGLAQRAPLLAATLTAAMLSMAGIPPLAGFVGKFYLFAAVVDQGQIWLAFIGFVMSMISVYYYLLVTRTMYMLEPAGDAQFAPGAALRAAALVSLALTLFFGVYPGPLAELANLAARSLFH